MDVTRPHNLTLECQHKVHYGRWFLNFLSLLDSTCTVVLPPDHKDLVIRNTNAWLEYFINYIIVRSELYFIKV